MRKILYFLALFLIGQFHSTILRSQNVGIGISTPQTPLHILKNGGYEVLRIQANHPNSSFLTIWNNAQPKGFLGIVDQENNLKFGTWGGATSNSTGKIQFVTESTNVQMSILPNGNIGIGTENPSEKLDISGDMNLTGEININNIAGQQGEILQATGNGNMVWVDPQTNEFSNYKSFTFGSQSWTVPAGVDKIMVEMWAGGGGGNTGGGGGSGAYIKAQRAVVPGTVLNIKVGKGGVISSNGAIFFSTSSTITLPIEPNDSLRVSPGGSGLLDRGGYGGGDFTSGPQWMFKGAQGNDGASTTFNYSERSAGAFVRIRKGGKGGDAYNHPDSGGEGATAATNLADNILFEKFDATDGTQPGGGGGGGVVGAQNGAGGAGMVIVYW